MGEKKKTKKTHNGTHKTTHNAPPQDCASHNEEKVVEGTLVSEEKPPSEDALAVVQNTPLKEGGGGGPWTWSKKKRRALALTVQGMKQIDISKELRVHRNTVRNWAIQPEWLAELRREVQDKQLSSKFRRINVTTSITDQLARRSLTSLQGDRKLDVGQSSLLLNQHAQYVRLEREQFGENKDSPSPAGTNINITLGTNGQPLSEVSEIDDRPTLSKMAFREWMAKLPATTVINAPDEPSALIEVGRKVLQETDILDTVKEEDREQLRRESEAEEASRRRR